ncbi:hypothetical protein PINS_up019778 [Pythium insidiosum]|nr:hypothetical protein PINS_up019778 [Pythium insidiosum]
MADDPAKEDFTPSRTFVNGFKAYGPFIVAGWCAFELARRKIERAYYSRERSAETASPSTATARASGLWGWAVPFFTTSDDVLLQNCGMDTLFYLRFLRLCQKLAWMGILLSAALFPIYYYGQRDDADSLFRMTLSHLNPDKDDQRWRFWATTVAMYIMSAWTCYLLRLEFIEYVRRRHEFLSRKDTMQYSVIINDLPTHLRTQQTLRNFLEVLFPKSVLHVYVAVECGDLEKLVAEREKVRNRLEHALALSAKTGERALTKKGLCGAKVDAIELYEGQLKSLNDAVEMEVRTILRNQAALANQMLEGGLESGSGSDIPTLQGSPDQIVIVDDGRAAESDYIKNLRSANRGVRNTGIMRPTGFVTFNKLRAAQSVQQVLQCSNPTEMHVEPAPQVEDVVWENIGISADVKAYWGLISLAISSAIILFWTIPTSFVVALSNVDKIRGQWPALGRFADKNTWVVPVLEQISPLMLSVMNALAPIIFGILSKREGHSAAATVETSLFNKLIAYQWFIVFLLPFLGGTFLESLLGKGEKLSVSKTINKVSNALPTQSSFYVNFLMVQMGLPLSLELLRVVPIVKAIIYHFLAPKLTPRERSSPWFGLTPLSVPGNFGVMDPLSQYFFVFLLIVVFAPVAPILCYFAAAYLLLSELVHRWNVLCVADPSPSTGAVYYPSLYRYCIGALAFAQFVMATALGLKKAPGPAAASLVLVGFTSIFHLFMWSRYPRTAANLPLDECVMVDSRRQMQPDDLEKVLEDVYRQPAMAQREPLVPDYHHLTSDPNDYVAVESAKKESVA